MKDIVEMLRSMPAREMLYLDGCVAAGYGPTVETQAADEIARLRADLAAARDALQKFVDAYGTYDVKTWMQVRDNAIAVLSAQYSDDCATKRLQADIAAARALLLETLAFIRWNEFGECRTNGFPGMPRMASDLAQAIEAALAKGV